MIQWEPGETIEFVNKGCAPWTVFTQTSIVAWMSLYKDLIKQDTEVHDATDEASWVLRTADCLAREGR